MTPRAYLLDIEGTTTPVDFVTRTLFPYARQKMADYVALHRDDDDFKLLADEASTDADYPMVYSPDQALGYLLWLMDRDRKSTALKAIQGKIWEQGYRDGELKGEVYPDVLPAIERWRRLGARVFIYSSGSVLAQRLIFEHLPTGSALSLFDGNFDTLVGPKREAASYAQIAMHVGLHPHEMLFVSDVIEEVVAAREAGLRAVLISRPEEGKASPPDAIASFAEIP